VSSYISRYRWYAALLLVIVGAICIVVYMVRPVTITLLLDTKDEVATWESINNSDQLPNKIEELDDQIISLYNALQEGEGKLDFNEAELLARVYDVADDIGFTVSKVEMGDPLTIPGGREYPIEIGGSGDYNSIGKLISHIENLNRFTRITYCTVKKGSSYNSLSFFLEFMVMEEM